jgi:DNA-binding GntR family transcriptional regulator
VDNLTERESQAKQNGISKLVLSDQVKQYILDAIERGELAPGERLVESQLARQFRISQAPVREAIRDLVSAGFLAREPHKGAMVRLLTDEDMVEIYTVRASLESLAAQQAVQRITEGHLQLLRQIVTKMSGVAAAQDYISAARYDWQFHNLIMEISGIKLLSRIYANLQLAQYTLITMRRSSLSLEQLAARHLKIIEALETRDPELAKNAMWEHIEELRPASMRVRLKQP